LNSGQCFSASLLNAGFGLKHKKDLPIIFLIT
jgi:hypothetical protein